MATCMDIILKKFQIDDSNINLYLESVLENAADEFQSIDDVYNAVGPILESSTVSDSSREVMEVCKLIYDRISLMFDRSNGEQQDFMKKLNAPVHIASAENEEIVFETSSIWIGKQEKKSTVDQKKLEKAEAKIKQKQDRKDKIVKNSSTNSLTNMEASASQSINRKDVKTESQGKHKVMDVHIENFDISFGNKVLFEGANLHVACGRRYGLVGRNGMGKTTLLKMLSTRGLSLPKHLTILHVEQEVEGDDTIALQSVLESDTIRENLLKEEKRLHLEMENKSSDPSLSTRLSEIYTELTDIEADKAPAKAAVILTGLGFTPEMQKMTTKEFSGGWRMRLALARALFGKPDLLLLDEPTNMLDIRAIMWLEDYLQEWPSTAIIVSHDRSFLESVCTDILHLTSRQLDAYRGSYEQFMLTKDEKLKNRQKEYEAQKQYRDHIQVFIDRFRYNANRASQVQSKLKLLEKLPKITPVEKLTPPVIRFPSHAVKLAGTVLRLDEVMFHYLPGETIFKNVNISAGLDSRICIVGENGSGKTTMLKILNGSLEPVKGIRHTHQNLRIGYFTQHHVDQLEMGVTSVELLASKFPGRNDEEYRHQLGSYGVAGDLALRPVSSLSGGQKSRVAFALMSMSRPNFLILDEPTNHLDMETIEALGIAINDFAGGVILVSHDERLIRLVCRELWLCGNQSVKSLEGGIETYRRLLEEEFKRIGIK
uniref:ATP-binding cassette sub-family F member 3 n=1 Tax=Phallusia mammillata TaxID=59560 RepID=A0A6F9D628_9ASCI|nr:ATP-binding cassette sub-family F member 3 [Phallusia mammillata]